MAKRHYEMRFGGTGGQGMMLLGDVLAEAAGIRENREVVLLKSYGPEARGGACRSELIIDVKPVNYPALTRPDFVLAMSQTACDRYTGDMNPETGVLLVDCDLVERVPAGIPRVYRLPLTQIAQQTTGRTITANVAALGAISILSEAAGTENVLAVILSRFPGKFREMNRSAFETGADAARRAV